MTIRDTMEGLNQIADHLGHASNVLANRSTVALSEARAAYLAGNPDGAKDLEQKAKRLDLERANRLKLLDYARAAISHLKPKAKRAGFEPPSKGAVIAYAATIKLPLSEADAFMDHYTSNGWKIGGRARMSDWQAAVRNWKRRGELKDRQAAANPDTDPDGWREFLKDKNTGYHKYRTAAEYMHRDFALWRKRR